MTDTIAIMLTKIRNAIKVNHVEVFVQNSKMNLAILDILKKSGYISDYIVEEGRDKKSLLKVFLKYSENNAPAIREIKRISKPGRRVYCGYRELKSVKSGMGMAIVSTPEGLMSNFSARKKSLGGELICEIF